MLDRLWRRVPGPRRRAAALVASQRPMRVIRTADVVGEDAKRLHRLMQSASQDPALDEPSPARRHHRADVERRSGIELQHRLRVAMCDTLEVVRRERRGADELGRFLARLVRIIDREHYVVDADGLDPGYERRMG